MDQLQVALSVLKKQYFWVVSALILLVALGSWYKATGDLAQRYEQRKSKVEGYFSSLQTIVSEPKHPNEAVIQGIVDKTERLRKEVYKAWEILYLDQKAKNQLSPKLPQRFRDYWEAAGPDAELPRDLREDYQIFIVDHIPKLFDMVGVRRPAARQQEGEQPAAPGGARAGAMEVDQFEGVGTAGRAGEREAPDVQMVGIVDWPDHEQLMQRFFWESVPSTLRVRMAQEDLWVYEALLRVIKNTNEGATTYENAAVKRINAIQIGQEALGAAPKKRGTGASGGPLFPTTSAAGGFPVTVDGNTDVDQFSAGASMPTTAGAPSTGTLGMPAAPQSAADAERAELLDGRYVDEEGNPLRLQPGQEKIEHPYAEFKMMPIRLELVMDQRKIRRLLAECANSSMPIEVKRLSIIAQEGRRPGAGSRVPSLAGPRGPGGMLPQTLPATLPATLPTSGEQMQFGPWDLPIEIEGIIYIYNRPDPTLLGTGTAAKEKGAGTEAEQPEQPAQPEQHEPAQQPPAQPTPIPAQPGGGPSGIQPPPGGAPQAPAATPPGGPTPPGTAPAGLPPATTPAPGAPAGTPAAMSGPAGIPAGGTPPAAPSGSVPAATQPAPSGAPPLAPPAGAASGFPAAPPAGAASGFPAAPPAGAPGGGTGMPGGTPPR